MMGFLFPEIYLAGLRRPSSACRRLLPVNGEKGHAAPPPFPLVPLAGESDCLCCQVFCHGLWSLMMALSMVSSFRMVATMATIFGLPAATR